MAWSEHAIVRQAGPDHLVRGSESEIFLTTFSVFHAVFQVLGHIRGRTLSTKSPDIDRHIMRLWPPAKRPLDWPPALVVFSEQDLDDFAMRSEFTLGDPVSW